MELPPQNLPFLFAAFAVAWIVFFAYAGYMSWKRQTAQRELRELSDEWQTQRNTPPENDGP